MRYLKDKSYSRNQQLQSEVNIRKKDEIPSEQIYFSTKFFESHETMLGDKDDPYQNSYLTVDSDIHTPIIRTNSSKNLLMNS